MPNARTPLHKASVTGAAAKNPGRYRDRTAAVAGGLGNPSTFLTAHGVEAWHAFKAELPWLAESDRAFVEVCCGLRGRMLAGQDIGVTALSLLQSCLSKLGATPADRSRIAKPAEADAYPASRYFH